MNLGTRNLRGSLLLSIKLVLGGWLALVNISISALIVSNTVRGFVPVSPLVFVAGACLVCYLVLGGSAILAVRAHRSKESRPFTRFANRLAVVGFIFVAVSLVAMAA